MWHVALFVRVRPKQRMFCEWGDVTFGVGRNLGHCPVNVSVDMHHDLLVRSSAAGKS